MEVGLTLSLLAVRLTFKILNPLLGVLKGHLECVVKDL